MIVYSAEKAHPPLESIATPNGAVRIDYNSKPLPVHDVRTFSSELRKLTRRERTPSSSTWPSTSNLESAESPAR